MSPKSRSWIANIPAYSEIGTYAVHRPIVRRFTLPVYDKRIRVSRARSWDDPRCQFNQALKTPPIQRQIICKFAVHDGAHGCICRVHFQGAAFDRNGFRLRSELQREILLYPTFDLKRDTFSDDLFKA